MTPKNYCVILYTKMKQEKRAESRITAYLPTDYDIIGQAKKEFGSTTSRDLSQKGIKILTEKFYPPGTKFLLKLNLKEINKILELMAQSKWASNIQFSNRYQNGLCFDDLTPQQKRTLEEYINLKQTITDSKEVIK